MDLLKKENWWIWLIIYLFGQGVGIYILAALLKVYDKEAWYCKWQYWLIGILCCIFPAIIMFSIFTIQISMQTAKKLDIPGSEIYTNPYVWIVGLIIPIIGWICLAVISTYISIFTLVALFQGNAEKYIN